MFNFPSRKAVWVPLLLLNSLVAIVFLPCQVQSTTGVGNGNISIEDIDLSARVVKLVFTFDEEMGSGDFHDRSTSWLIIRQYDFNASLPIGRADPDWKLIGTNNVTVWHWRLEKTFYFEYEDNGNVFLRFPCEVYNVDFYVASNISRWFSASTAISSFSASIDQQWEDYNQSSCPYKPEGCPYLERIRLAFFHNPEYKTIVFMLYSILGILFAIAFCLVKRIKDSGSNFFTISTAILVFVPILFFAFRDIAPPYLTFFDVLCLISAILYGGLVLIRLIYKEYTNSKKADIPSGIPL